jgi:HlyD family secretion protein
MKRFYVVSGIIVIFSIAALIVFSKLTSQRKTAALYATVTNGDFEVSVSTAGELLAESSIDIKGPEVAQRGEVRAANLRIQDIVPEGTVVRKGDYVAQLDKSEFQNTLKDILDRLQTMEKDLNMQILDTAVTLSSYRDDIVNQKYVVDADSITLRNSKYESPNIQRQAEINYDQSKRTLGQRKRRYMLATATAQYRIDRSRLMLKRMTKRKTDYEELLASFTITAPSDGMVIYKKDMGGAKRKVGSMVNSFDRVVATVPDLRSMMSRIFISEIDISKVKPGQSATIVVDAFPTKSFKGKVATVANIGEKLPNSDSKVFEVMVKINDTDPALRPSMTTSNKVVLATFTNVNFIPSECVHATEDSIPFVYTKKGTRQVVILGASNDKNVIIEKGLSPKESVYIATPENPDNFKLTGNELIAEIRKREAAFKAENQKYIKL